MKILELNEQETNELIDLLEKAKIQTWSKTYKAILGGILTKLKEE